MEEPKNKSTLVFLLKNTKILLAMKKRGFGKGRWNGVGGKPESNETIIQAAIRESEEEIHVTPNNLILVAKLNFTFPEAKSAWDQQVHVFTSIDWEGVPAETEEMKPKWFRFDDIPYDEMWDDDKYWLPQVLKNNYVKATFRFDSKDKITHQEVEVLKSPYAN